MLAIKSESFVKSGETKMVELLLKAGVNPLDTGDKNILYMVQPQSPFEILLTRIFSAVKNPPSPKVQTALHYVFNFFVDNIFAQKPVIDFSSLEQICPSWTTSPSKENKERGIICRQLAV